MNLEPLFRQIQGLDYVIMRNWETMPPDGDIDFYVHPDDEEALREACRQHLDEKWYDIRTLGDGYFPDKLGRSILADPVQVGLFFVPDPGSHFASLFYHQHVHKGDHRYEEKLKEILFKEFPPVKPEDPGVGYHGPDTN